jgi:hypothetical protein
MGASLKSLGTYQIVKMWLGMNVLCSAGTLLRLGNSFPAILTLAPRAVKTAVAPHLKLSCRQWGKQVIGLGCFPCSVC